MIAKHIIFSPLNYINVSPPKIYKVVIILCFMKVLKVKSREYKNKQYYKYRINISSEILEKSGFKEGDELEAETIKGKIILKKVSKYRKD